MQSSFWIETILSWPLFLFQIQISLESSCTAYAHTGIETHFLSPFIFHCLLFCVMEKGCMFYWKPLLGNDTCQCVGMDLLLLAGLQSVSYTLFECQIDVFRWGAVHRCKTSVIILSLSLPLSLCLHTRIFLWKIYTKCHKNDKWTLSKFFSWTLKAVITSSQNIPLFRIVRDLSMLRSWLAGITCTPT